jgi:hypothetical protein
MAGYVRNKDVDDENYISASSFGPDVGLLGALHLAEQALV